MQRADASPTAADGCVGPGGLPTQETNHRGGATTATTTVGGCDAMVPAGSGFGYGKRAELVNHFGASAVWSAVFGALVA